MARTLRGCTIMYNAAGGMFDHLRKIPDARVATADYVLLWLESVAPTRSWSAPALVAAAIKNKLDVVSPALELGCDKKISARSLFMEQYAEVNRPQRAHVILPLQRDQPHMFP